MQAKSTPASASFKAAGADAKVARVALPNKVASPANGPAGRGMLVVPSSTNGMRSNLFLSGCGCGCGPVACSRQSGMRRVGGSPLITRAVAATNVPLWERLFGTTDAPKPPAVTIDPTPEERVSLTQRHNEVLKHFPTAMGVDDLMARVEMALAAYGFRGDNTIGAWRWGIGMEAAHLPAGLHGPCTVLLSAALICPSSCHTGPWHACGTTHPLPRPFPTTVLTHASRPLPCPTPALRPTAMSNLCRDESCMIVEDKIEAVFGSSFSTHGLGGVLTCGVIGMGAGLSHSPVENVRAAGCWGPWPPLVACSLLFERLLPALRPLPALRAASAHPPAPLLPNTR